MCVYCFAHQRLRADYRNFGLVYVVEDSDDEMARRQPRQMESSDDESDDWPPNAIGHVRVQIGNDDHYELMPQVEILEWIWNSRDAVVLVVRLLFAYLSLMCRLFKFPLAMWRVAYLYWTTVVNVIGWYLSAIAHAISWQVEIDGYAVTHGDVATSGWISVLLLREMAGGPRSRVYCGEKYTQLYELRRRMSIDDIITDEDGMMLRDLHVLKHGEILWTYPRDRLW